MNENSKVTSVADIAHKLKTNVQEIIVGKSEAIELALVALLCRGHMLIEDVPGIGKTSLAKALALSLGCEFKRIQFTPDLMPSDVTGVNYFNQKSGEFEFRPGPIFTQILLADEVNRATPRTQSSLLESMQEQQVTIDGQTMPLPLPFLVIATQNPIEMEGTFPLPEAQLDRFMLKVELGYPTMEEEKSILQRFEKGSVDVQPVVQIEQLLDTEDEIQKVHVESSLRDYIVRLIQRTRSHTSVELGASPRAALAMFKASQALAAIHLRDFAIPDDVKYLAPKILGHRLKVNSQASMRGVDTNDVIAEILSSEEIPISI